MFVCFVVGGCVFSGVLMLLLLQMIHAHIFETNGVDLLFFLRMINELIFDMNNY